MRSWRLSHRVRSCLFPWIAVLLGADHGHAQVLSKEYIRLNGQVIAIENAPPVTVTPTTVSFGSQALGTPSNDQTITLTNGTSASLTFSSVPTIAGANAGDFAVSDSGCSSSFAPLPPGQYCTVTVNFTPQLEGSRNASLTFTYVMGTQTGTQTVTVPLSGTGAGTLPGVLTTYLTNPGSTPSPFNGSDVILPIRAYNPGGASQISSLQVYLNTGSSTEYSISVAYNSGSYSLILSNGSSNANLSPLAPGSNPLSTPLTVGTLQLSAYRFALAGNELQLDLSLTRTDSFNDQIIIDASAGSVNSTPWNAPAGQWSSGSASGSTCNGANIATSILAGVGSWQCWTAAQLNTTNYGNPYWNGKSGDGPSSNIGWLLLGTGNQLPLSGSTSAPLGYFGLPGGEAPSNLYFVGTGAAVTVTLIQALTNNDGAHGPAFDTFGWYEIDPNNPNKAPTTATMHFLVGPFAGTTPMLSATFTPTQYYGLYITAPTGTYFSQPQFNSNPDTLQHFAVFQQSASFYYVGVEDTDESESDLDYNDMVVTLSVAPPGAAYSLYTDGSSYESVNIPDADPFNDLRSWRLETRLHGITANPNGGAQYFWRVAPGYITYWLALTPDATTLTLGNIGENPTNGITNQFYCSVALNGATDIQIRFQRNATTDPNTNLTTGNYQLQVWNTITGQLLDDAGNCGTVLQPTVSLAGGFIVGQGYVGGMAFLRIYNTVSASSLPPSNFRPGGELLDYEFENADNLGLDTSGNNQTLSPSGSPTRVPTPGAGATPTLPTVSFNPPGNGATLTGTTPITAAPAATTPGASVSSVQIQLDGANFGSALTAAPYSTSWDTTSVPNGAHTLTAIVTDTFGERAAATITVTTSNAGAPQGWDHSLYTDGSSEEDVTLPDQAAFNSLSSWRLETRIHGIAASPGGYQFFWRNFDYLLDLTADGSTLGLANVGENPAGSTANQFYCNVALNGATDIQIRFQRNWAAQAYQLQVWNTMTGELLADAGNCGALLQQTISLAGWFSLGQNYAGGMAFLRVYNTAVTSSTPPSNLRPGGELVDYEFENPANLGEDGSGNNLTLTASGDPTQVPTPGASGTPTPPTISFNAPATGTVLTGTTSIAAAPAATTPGASVRSVQLQLDGANFGSALTTSPYSTSWDTTAVPNGTHTLTAIVTDTFGERAATSVTVAANNAGAPPGWDNSLYVDGSSEEDVTLPNEVPFNNLSSFRVETRIHGITASPTGRLQQFWMMVSPWFVTYALTLSPDGTSLGLANVGENPGDAGTNQFYCNVALNGATDIQIRFQRNWDAGIYQLQVWNTATGQPLVDTGTCGNVLQPTVSLAGALVVGRNYQGGMAYLRVYNTAITSSTPPSNLRPGGELLDYEFENAASLGEEGSGNDQTLSPSGNPTQAPTPPGGNN